MTRDRDAFDDMAYFEKPPVTDVWREELIAVASQAIHDKHFGPAHAVGCRPFAQERADAEAALAAVLPLIEEHERAGWKQVGWRNKFGSVIAREWAERRGNTAHYEGGNDWRPVYVRELELQPDPHDEADRSAFNANGARIWGEHYREEAEPQPDETEQR